MPTDYAKDTAILIPSYQPDGKLAPYVSALSAASFQTIVVVDDGSGDAYTPVFDEVAAFANVHVIRYTPNHGKGYALRAGFRYLLDECPDCAFCVTADSDGQHTVEDTLRLSEELHRDSNGLLLGSRDFSQSDVPPKSRMGNRITTFVFHALYGKHVGDTQTGLRGCSRDLMRRFLDTKGDRYEFEMNELIDCAAEKVVIREMPIKTVYENNNEGTHFNPIKDSWRIYRVILGRFFRFISASMIGFLVDYGLYLLLNNVLRSVPELNHEFRFLFIKFIVRIAIATVAARIVSSIVNYVLNRKFVFSSDGSIGRTFLRYIATCVLIMLLSAGLVSSCHLWFGWSDNIVKIPVDILLFFLSYYLQRKWVFQKDHEKECKKDA